MKTGTKLLVVEDDADILELIRLTLESQGYDVLTAADGNRGLQLFHQEKPVLVLLDILLPGMTGLDICQDIRRSSATPILFLTCKRDAEDIIGGLELGADDYMTKPFDPAILVARVRAILRRTAGGAADNRISKYGSLEIDWPGRTVLRDGEPVSLFTKERQLLFVLLEHRNQVISVSQIYALVWGLDNASDEQTVKVHISNLRKKIEDDPAHPKFIQTVRGFGYKFSTS